MKLSIRNVLLGAALGIPLAVVACVQTPPDDLGTQAPNLDDPTTQIPDKPGAFSGGDKNTFDHMSDLGGEGARDPFDILAQRQEEGPPEVRTRLHSCQKVQIGTLSNILASLGVDMGAQDASSAAQLLKNGGGALGAANYDARVGETITWSAAGAAKLFDVFVQAAPEVIKNLPSVPQCQVNGVGPEVFDASNHCNADAITCIIGRPATAAHTAICDKVVQSASSVEVGKKIAVATLLAGAHSCE